MNCAWDAFIKVLPVWMREEVNKIGRTSLLELRLRVGLQPELICKNSSVFLSQTVTVNDIKFCINTASGYSPWAATTISQGYITSPGGHRIGVCGDAIILNGSMTGIRSPTMLCIRIARDFPGIARNIPYINTSVLIIGKPGCGKTTLLRDLIRIYSNAGNGSIGVVDERLEIFPQYSGTSCFQGFLRADIISGCSKKQGVEMLLRCMGPSAIAVDEITSEEDCIALEQAAWCGVNLFATAHAKDKTDLMNRQVYRRLIDNKVFDVLVFLSTNKSWKLEWV